MTDHFDELCELVRDAGLRMTFDPGRDITKPCQLCGAGGTHGLFRVATYCIATQGGIQPGDGMFRPVCRSCSEDLVSIALRALDQPAFQVKLVELSNG